MLKQIHNTLEFWKHQYRWQRDTQFENYMTFISQVLKALDTDFEIRDILLHSRIPTGYNDFTVVTYLSTIGECKQTAISEFAECFHDEFIF